jgi:FkbM family methyltransferase
MANFFRAGLTSMNRQQVSRFLTRRRKSHIARYPQLVCFAFDSIAAQIMVNGRYEDGILSCLETTVFPKLARKRVCLDVGANIGNHAVAFASSFQRVICFEPNPDVYRVLEINAALKTNIETRNIGASNCTQTLTATVWSSNIGSATVEENLKEKSKGRGHSKQVAFKLECLDTLLDAATAATVDFVKIDVEGHEVSVLEGAAKLLSTQKPVVALEVLKVGFQSHQHPAIQLLQSFGYDHFYTVETPRMKQGKFLRRIMDVLPDSFHEAQNRAEVTEISNLTEKDYPMLLASCGKLNL